MQKKAYWSIKPIIFGETNNFYCEMWKILSKKRITNRKVLNITVYPKY